MNPETSDHAWFVDANSGRSESWRALMHEIAAPASRFGPIYQPENTRDALVYLTQALAVGASVVLIDSAAGPQEIAEVGIAVDQINTAHVGTSEVSLERLQPSSWSENKELRIGLFTSGSTGLPKRVDHPLANLARAVRVSVRHTEDVWGLAFPATHIAGVQVWLQALANRNTLVDLTGLGAAAACQAIESHGVTHLSATPTYCRLLMGYNQPLTGVRSVALGGEIVDAQLLEGLRALFPNARVRNVYASTEAGTLLESAGDVFTIVEGLEGKVRLHEGRIRVHRSLLGEFGETGESVKRPNSEPVMNGEAVERADGEAEAKRGAVKQSSCEAVSGESVKPSNSGAGVRDSFTDLQFHGLTGSSLGDDAWYDTGDAVEIISKDPLRFRIVGRERDWVNVGGDKVNPHEVEEALCAHPAVKQARVFGRKNSVMGSILCAEVVLQKVESGKPEAENKEVSGGEAVGDGEAVANREAVKQLHSEAVSQSHSVADLQFNRLTEAALRAWLGGRLQPFKVPRLIRFVDSLVTTRTGKLFRL